MVTKETAKTKKTPAKAGGSEHKYDTLKLENQICFPLYAASREIVKRYHPFLSELDLTYTQYITLMVMWEERRISVKELGKKLFLDSGTLTPVLKNLESRGIITRNRSAEDERVLIVEITDAGMKLRESAVDIPRKMAACTKLDLEDAKELYRLLYKLLT